MGPFMEQRCKSKKTKRVATHTSLVTRERVLSKAMIHDVLGIFCIVDGPKFNMEDILT